MKESRYCVDCRFHDTIKLSNPFCGNCCGHWEPGNCKPNFKAKIKRKTRRKAAVKTSTNKRLPGSQPKRKMKSGIVSAVRPKAAKRGLRVA